jgi:hypothetical protein
MMMKRVCWAVLLFDGTAQQQLTKRKRSPPALLFVLRDEYHLTPFENHNNISQHRRAAGPAKICRPTTNQITKENEKEKTKLTDLKGVGRFAADQRRRQHNGQHQPATGVHGHHHYYYFVVKISKHTTRNETHTLFFLFTLESNGRTRRRQFNPIIFWPQSNF